MASINDMIQYGVIKVGDTIEFMLAIRMNVSPPSVSQCTYYDSGTKKLFRILPFISPWPFTTLCLLGRPSQGGCTGSWEMLVRQFGFHGKGSAFRSSPEAWMCCSGYSELFFFVDAQIYTPKKWRQWLRTIPIQSSTFGYVVHHTCRPRTCTKNRTA